jgi:hypothetical protein
MNSAVQAAATFLFNILIMRKISTQIDLSKANAEPVISIILKGSLESIKVIYYP